MKKIDLSDLKVGDKAWSYQYGELEVIGINSSGYFSIITEKSTYSVSGMYLENNIYPTLFHSEQEFREYFNLGVTLEAVESNQLTKREQFTMAAMQGLLASPTAYSVKIKDLVSDAIDIADFTLSKLNENNNENNQLLVEVIITKLQDRLKLFRDEDDAGLYDRGLYDGYLNSINILTEECAKVSSLNNI
jgi:hypothetical protein